MIDDEETPEIEHDVQQTSIIDHKRENWGSSEWEDDAFCVVVDSGENPWSGEAFRFFPIAHWDGSDSYQNQNGYHFTLSDIKWSASLKVNEWCITVKWDWCPSAAHDSLIHQSVFIDLPSDRGPAKTIFIEMVQDFCTHHGALHKNEEDLDLRLGLINGATIQDIRDTLQHTKGWPAFWQHLARGSTIELIATFGGKKWTRYYDAAVEVDNGVIFHGNRRWWIFHQLHYLLVRHRANVVPLNDACASEHTQMRCWTIGEWRDSRSHRQFLLHVLRRWSQLPFCLGQMIVQKLDQRVHIHDILDLSNLFSSLPYFSWMDDIVKCLGV